MTIDKSKIYKDHKTDETKVCFCIGPENCKDRNCSLVQQRKKRKEKK